MKKELSYFEQIRALAYRDARDQTGLSGIQNFLRGWWSEFYNRPLKDPILQQYSVEELAYEYYLHGERRRFRDEQVEAENDKIEEQKWEEAEAWADEMERLEEEKEQTEQQDEADTDKPDKTEYDPLKDPNNIEWMEEEIAKHKTFFGDDFGEDISVDFEED